MDEESSQSNPVSNRSMPPGTIIPELVYGDVDSAAAWLCETFGFKERLRIGNHRAQLIFGEASIVVIQGDEPGPPGAVHGADLPPQGGVTHSLMVRVADVDGHYEHVQQRQARILRPPETYPFGERQYTVEDPGGHRWTFSQSVADVAPEEWGGKTIRSL